MSPKSGSYDVFASHNGKRGDRHRKFSSRVRRAMVRVSNEGSFFSNSMRSACLAGIDRELRRRNGA